jgi:hypothetical protein
LRVALLFLSAIVIYNLLMTNIGNMYGPDFTFLGS